MTDDDIITHRTFDLETFDGRSAFTQFMRQEWDVLYEELYFTSSRVVNVTITARAIDKARGDGDYEGPTPMGGGDPMLVLPPAPAAVAMRKTPKGKRS